MTQIRCPHCHNLIDIDQALTQELEGRLRERMERELKEQIERTYTLQIQRLHQELEEKSRQVVQLYEAQARIRQLEREKEEALARAKREMQEELTTLLQRERQQLQEELRQQEEELRQRIALETQMELKEKEIQLQQLKQQLQEAQRKIEQKSQQLQGEVQELLIEEWLRANFPLDEIQQIRQGARGGDCLQIVNDTHLPRCGTIYYESKRTKEFQRAWIEKLKEDMREVGADVGVIVTQTMPKGMDRMGLIEGVWVCTFQEFKALSAILRHHLIALASLKRSQQNSKEKMELLYNYLTSNEFRMHIEAIIESFTQMQEELDREKRAMQRIWKQREKQLQKVLTTTSQMYGALQGIVGGAIPPIHLLELPYDN
ncbi:MAG: DUF2130 domain-containing protein [Nitratiruptor sp.]|nr:DUF2130 domain-containing protein [Nitratiruptor sp.]NPA83602.1 DUF2130 domain-containing protein [Campylobacterota bacterium]